MEIKVGEYIRTKRGIAKVIPDGKYVQINEDENKKMIYVDKNGIPCSWEFSFYIWSNEIIKHSSNIIDLIEEGDYVNGKLIHKVDIRENSAYIYYGNGKTFCDYQIKDVVTKEQFEQMKYIVGDE